MGHEAGHRLHTPALTESVGARPPDPADPGTLTSLLERRRIRPRHRLGQNFLIDPVLRDRVVDAARVAGDDEVLEVGAGAGALTVRLTAIARRTVAVELDEKLVALLRSLLADARTVDVVQGDILKLDLRGLFPEGGHIVAGNIPYYLSGALLRALLDEAPRPKRLSLVVQKEVAERWLGSSGWSLATLAVHVFSEPRLALVLPPEAFLPVPAVSSALVVMEVRPEPALRVDSLQAFFRLAERLFQFRRKQLQGSVARIADLSAAEAAARLESIGVPPNARAEELRLLEWERLYALLASGNPGGRA